MNTNCNQPDLHPELTTKNSRSHFCAHECLAAVEPQLTPREAASKEEKSANHDGDTRETNLEHAIVIGAVLILALVTVVFYWKFAALDNATDGTPTSTLQPITRH